jgi:hypothetical protein
VRASGNGHLPRARYGQNDRVIALGRKNYLFAGSDVGGRRAAALYALIETVKLSGLDPQKYLADVLARIERSPGTAHRRFAAPALETRRAAPRRRLTRRLHRALTAGQIAHPLIRRSVLQQAWASFDSGRGEVRVMLESGALDEASTHAAGDHATPTRSSD